MKKKYKFLISFVTIIILLFTLSFIPHKIITLRPNDVASIYIFNGNTGESITIEEQSDIDNIINNLNNITFHKNKCSLGKMGYGYRLNITIKNSIFSKKLIINSTNTIRYCGFFYIDPQNSIDYEYISSFFN